MKALFSTDLAPCPYLTERLERRLVSVLSGADPDDDHDRLLRAGFRRSQRFAYRPACPGCNACVPVRIPVARFVMTRTWRRILARNFDLKASEQPPEATFEQYGLFERYLKGRHDQSGMTEMTFDDYRAMVGETSVDTRIVEWRAAGGRLMAVSLTDRTRHALSGVYKFFEPDEPKRSLGSHIILWHVLRAREQGLTHVYLGYWIAESPKMAYKARFQPLEQLAPGGWRPLLMDAALADAGPPERTARN